MDLRRAEAVVVFVDLSLTGHIRCAITTTTTLSQQRAAWTSEEVNASRRIALARQVCGLLPTLKGRGDERLAVVP